MSNVQPTRVPLPLTRMRLVVMLLVIALPISFATGQDAEEKDTPAAEAVEQEPFDLSAWMTGFHKAPDPDRLSWVIREMSRGGSFARNGGMLSAFLAEIFRKYPDRVAQWAGDLDGLPDDHRHWIYIAVWWSEVPEADAILEAAEADETPKLQKALRKYVEKTPRALLEMPLTKPERLDMLWASYFASGKAAYVERIATALELRDAEEKTAANVLIYGAARWSLTSNAKQHEDVLEILENLLERCTGAVREELEAILEKVRPDEAREPDAGADDETGDDDTSDDG